MPGMNSAKQSRSRRTEFFHLADNDDPQPAGAHTGPSDIRPVSITEEMKRSDPYYAMSVIVARALPDVRDGLKPVHRRQPRYSMHENGHTPDKKIREIGARGWRRDGQISPAR